MEVIRPIAYAGIAWLFEQWAVAMIPRSEALQYDRIGDYFTLLLMKPFNVVMFLIFYSMFFVLIRRAAYMSWMDLNLVARGILRKIPLYLVLLLILFTLVLSYLKHPYLFIVIAVPFILYDVQRWFRARRNHMKLKRFFREYQ